MILTMMKVSFQVGLANKTSLEIARVDCSVLGLLLNNLLFMMMKSSTANLCLNAQIGTERDHAKTLSMETLLCIDGKATSRRLLKPTASQRPYQKEPQKHDIAHSSWLSVKRCIIGFSVSLNACFTIRGKAYLTCHYGCLQRLKLVMKLPPYYMSPANTAIPYCRE